MKRVYVETNFLIDLLRPLSTREAESLYARHGQDLTLVIPWCSFREAQRTLDLIIGVDLGFADDAGRALARFVRQAAPQARTLAPHVNEFLTMVRKREQDAQASVVTDLERVRENVTVIPLSQRATEIALDLNRPKQLKPFDEMILGCVLADAEAHAGSPDARVFCNLNHNDFFPTDENGLKAAYSKVNLEFRRDFQVP